MPTTMQDITTEIPFGHFVYATLHLKQHLPFEKVIEAGYQYERPYLAWEEVRNYRNPFFQKGTGFEGYFVGCCMTAEDALEHILHIGHEMLTNIVHLHPHDYRLQSRLIKTLTGEANDPYSITEWAAEFGAMLARLRCNVSCNRQAKQFYTETYQIIQWLPHIDYSENDHTIQQHMIIANDHLLNPTMSVEPHLLKPAEQEAWLVSATVGKFGHPLVREVLDLATK